MLGVAYYPEQFENVNISKDFSIMKSKGIEIVRIGEFMWSDLEKSEGTYDFSIIDECFRAAEVTGIKLILCTPTATPPSWLVRKHVDILQKDDRGIKKEFGSRRNYCYNSLEYRYYCEKIVKELASEYGKNKNLFAWQIDNEFGCEGTVFCYCEKCDTVFGEYLKNKYEKIEILNKAWGSSFWSQKYMDFKHIKTPKYTSAAKNPHQMLDYYYFCTDSIKSFADIQIRIIRDYSRVPLTHNFMVNFFDIDYSSLKDKFDFISYDNYIQTPDSDPLDVAFNLDLMWSLMRKEFTVMEQQPGRVNWQDKNRYYGSDVLMPMYEQADIHGAENVLFFRYRMNPKGAEQWHNALINDYENPENNSRIVSVGKMQKNKFKRPKGNAAIFFDYRNYSIHKINGVINDFDYVGEMKRFYNTLRKLGFFIDFIFEGINLSQYDVLIIPYSIFMNENLRNALHDFKGKIFFTCMSGLKNADNSLSLDKFPDLKVDGMSFKINDFGYFPQGELDFGGDKLLGTKWIEEIEEPKDLKVLARWSDNPLKGMPAILCDENEKLFYISTILDIKSLEHLLAKILKKEILFEEKETILYEGEKIFIDY